ncbi:cell division protein SepF [Pseudoglutamicibacter cumminsii]|uniref:cell division protein SepF n=1 Tax=Pseudoglutamicibacter cumminsii TaxID=156979 RepID=UPI00195DFB7E|nr:cell division protein SepF [Pseudoglutamicibacter cumminsii]MBM7795132.1 cell division inhibitor SepF [Pseudoglutamicibacter cumminsii]
MAGALRKTMIYLGLAEAEDDDVKRQEPAKDVKPAASEQVRHEVKPEPAAEQPQKAKPQLVEVAQPETEPKVAEDFRAPVTPIKRAASAPEEDTELRQITTVHPRSYNDAKTIGESFRDGIPVIMNVTDMGESEAKRLVDFSAGLVFALRGNIERVTNKVFLLTPHGVEILGEELTGDDQSAFFNQS